MTYFNYVRELQFSDTPDYKYLKDLFSNLMKKNGFYLDYFYDWTPSLKVINSIYPR